MTGLPWSERTAYIVGGGPSAARHDLTALDGIVVAVNDSARHLPNADVLFTASPPWVRNRRDVILGFRGLVVVRSEYGGNLCRRYGLPTSVLALYLRDDCTTPKKRRQHNSGHEALCWVAEMGARRIVLIGFDMDPSDPTNWHDGYEWMPDKSEDPLCDYRAWADGFTRTAAELEARGVEVLNANPDSHVRCFPFTDLPAPAQEAAS